jgi:hypothetical protein
MEPLDLYIMTLKNQLEGLEEREDYKESLVYQTMKACCELAEDIKKDIKKINSNGNI